MAEKVNTGLKSCPFCGTNKYLQEDFSSSTYRVRCMNCFTQGPVKGCKEAAADAWNDSRALLTPAQEHADELLDAVACVLHKLQLAVMGFEEVNIDANKLQALYNKISDEQAVIDSTPDGADAK